MNAMNERGHVTMGSLYQVFGDASGPYAFRGQRRDGRWWNGDVVAGAGEGIARAGQSTRIVGRASDGVVNFVLQAPAWAALSLKKAVESGGIWTQALVGLDLP
jgi:hypothetical protein